MPTRSAILSFVCAFCAAAAVSSPARACQVPVFRYALERWCPDLYEVIVFHRGPLNAEHRAAVKLLQDAAEDEDAPTNLVVRTVDLAKGGQKWMEGLYKPESLPWMAVFTPVPARYLWGGRLKRRKEGVVWSGPLDKAAAARLLDSPKRREVARRIRSGESAVWVLLECGDRKKDDAAAKLIETQLAEMMKVLKVPEQDPADYMGYKDYSNLPKLRVAFSMIRVSRKDAPEKMLVEMLLHSEEDLRGFDEPMTFPIFGRGRVLWALVGKGINVKNTIETCVFLVNGCSCKVKGMSPGMDVLIGADWDSAVEDSAIPQVKPPPLTGLAEKTTELIAPPPSAAGQPAATQPAGGAAMPTLRRRSDTRPASRPSVPVAAAGVGDTPEYARLPAAEGSGGLRRAALITLSGIVLASVALALAVVLRRRPDAG